MFKTLAGAWKQADVRKKIVFTLIAIVILRLGAAIPVPFINLDTLSTAFQAYNGTLLGYMNILSGGGLSTGNIFALSISPFINASIIIQLLTVAIPALESLARDGGEVGKKKIAKITKWVALVIAAVQAYGYYLLLKNQPLLGFLPVLEDDSILVLLTIVATFTAGSMVVMWIADRITERGIGNGTSIVLFVNIVSSLPSMGQTIYNMIATPVIALYYNITDPEYIVDERLLPDYYLNFVLGIISIVIFIAIIAFVVIMNHSERRIPVNYAKRVVGRKMMGGQNTHLPIKVSASGVMPIIFASSIVSLPGTIALFFGGYNPPADMADWQLTDHLMATTQQNSPVYIVVFFLFIIGFSYFYSAMQFNPIEIANNLKKNGGFIPGFRPGKPTTDFITKVLSKITFIGSMFLGILATLPLILGAIFPVLSGLALGGTSIVIMVGVALETMRQLESQMMMKHYKGFLE